MARRTARLRPAPARSGADGRAIGRRDDRQSGVRAALVDVDTRRGRPCHRARHTHHATHQDRRPAGRRRRTARCRPSPSSSSRSPTRARPVTQKTEVWVLFDDTNIYVACRCWDEHPERIVANDMRRDSGNHGQHDHFAVALDTFHDGRNGFQFGVTAAGGMRDGDDHRRAIELRLERRLGRQGESLRPAAGSPKWPFPSSRCGTSPAGSRPGAFSFAGKSAAKNERVYITPISPAWGISGVQSLLAGRDAGRARGAAAGAEPRNQAVRASRASRPIF